MTSNLLSATRLCDLGYEIVIKGKNAEIRKDGVIAAIWEKDGKLFRLRTTTAKALSSMAADKDDDMQLWHHRLGHLGEANVIKTSLAVDGMDGNFENSTLGTCDSCQVGKQTRTPSHKPSTRPTGPLELIHADTSGKISPPSLRGANYYGTFKDGYTDTPTSTDSRRTLVLSCANATNDAARKLKQILDEKFNVCEQTTAPNIADSSRGTSKRRVLFMRLLHHTPLIKMVLQSG